MSDHLLGQDEIDALLKGNMMEENESASTDMASGLEKEEVDALGEIGNISMGSAATTLYQILNRKVSITSPVVKTISKRELFESFTLPHLLIEVGYTEGLEGTTLLMMEIRDAAILADLMMGNDGSNPSQELTELEISAASEAMNQMIGTAATSMATLFQRTVNIGPPVPRVVTDRELSDQPPLDGEMVVVIYFNIVVEGLIDNTIMQILDLDTARAEAALLWQGLDSITTAEPVVVESVAPTPPVTAQPPNVAAEAPQQPPPPPAHVVTAAAVAQVDQAKLDMLLDIPLKVSVILGRSRQPVKEVLNMTPGVVVSLDMTVDEPVDIMINGTLVAKGEVVVVDENFGVRITSILSPTERLQQLRR